MLPPISSGSTTKTYLFNIRNALHGEPVMLYITVSENGVHLFPFNPHTGDATSLPGLSTSVLSISTLTVASLPFHDADFNHVVAVVAKNGAVTLLPNHQASIKAFTSHSRPVYLQTIDVQSGVVQGHQLHYASGTIQAVAKSQIVFDPAVETIVAVSTKGQEPIGSLGEALGDRKVLYKYIKSNSIAIATLSNYTLNAATLTVYLVNSIRGTIVDQVTHKGVQGPVHIAHSENWIVYHYLNKEDKQYEMSVTELYDNSEPGSVSSAFTTGDPIVMRQTYILPTAVTAIGVTTTQQGITFRQLLLALPSGSVLGLHKRLIDARRPLDDQAAAAEGVMPYRPILPVAHQMTVNYNLTVQRVHAISTHPSGLESTSLALVSGLDVFFIPVTPSKQFDLLSDDFNFNGLTLSLIALSAAVIALQKLAARKQLLANWA